MSDEEVGVSRCPDAARPMFRCLFPLPPTLVRAPRERLAQATDIKNQNAYPCAASIPIVDAGVTETMFSGDATVTGSLAAANPALRVGRRKAFWNASVPQEVQPFELTAHRNQRSPRAEPGSGEVHAGPYHRHSLGAVQRGRLLGHVDGAASPPRTQAAQTRSPGCRPCWMRQDQAHRSVPQ